MAMNPPHWHLAINHLPVVGIFLVVLLLGYAVVRGRGELYGVSLGAFVLLALATVAVFFTGRRADDSLMEFSDIDEHLVRAHEQAAYVASIGAWVLGGLALVTLGVWRKSPIVPRGVALGILLLALVETLLMGRAANFGGEIRHPEIRSSAPTSAGSPGKGEKK
jgi:uncharacterized membrane protein